MGASLEPPAASWERRFVIALFAVAWVLRIAFAVEYEHRHPLADRPVIDEAAYERRALEVAGGDWWGSEVYFQEPLYPWFLGVTYALAVQGLPAEAGSARRPDPGRILQRQRTAARHAQCSLGALLVLLVHRSTRRAFGPVAAAVAGVAAAFYGPLLAFPAYLLKPNLFLPVLLGLVLGGMRLRPGRMARPRSLLPWAGLGLLAGVAVLLRGNALLFLPFVLALPFSWPPFMWKRGMGKGGGLVDRGASAALVLIGAGVLLVPVSLHNARLGGPFAPTSGAGTNLYIGNSLENPLGRATELPFIRGIPEHEPDDWRREAERRSGRALAPGEVSDYWLSETLRSIRERPAAHAALFWTKLRLSLGRHELPDNHDLEWDSRYLFLLGLPWPGFGLWGWLGLGGVLLFCTPGRPRGRGSLVLLAFLLLYLASIVLSMTSMRYRLPLVPLLLPFAGYLVASLPGAWRARVGLAGQAPAPGLRIAACLVVSGALVFWPVLDSEERARELATRDLNHATYLLEWERLDEAREIASRLAVEFPGTSRVETLLAEIDARRALAILAEDPGPDGQERARSLERDALGRLDTVLANPGVGARERFRAHELSGLIRVGRGADPAGAVRHLRAAREFDPDDVEVRFALANALYQRATGADASAEARPLLEEAALLLASLDGALPAEVLREHASQVAQALAEVR